MIATIQYMMDFVNQRMNHSMIKLDNVRKNIDSYPQRALFEGVINAVAHQLCKALHKRCYVKLIVMQSQLQQSSKIWKSGAFYFA